MLEKFNEQQIELITKCAETIHSIETYRMNQRDINSLFGLSYLFTETLMMTGMKISEVSKRHRKSTIG